MKIDGQPRPFSSQVKLFGFSEDLSFSPASRYLLYEVLSVTYTLLISNTKLNTFRSDALLIRDGGLLLWTMMMIFSHIRLIAFIGVKQARPRVTAVCHGCP